MKKRSQIALQGESNPESKVKAPPPLALPGFHYDPETERYFKIESGTTAYWSQAKITQREARQRQLKTKQENIGRESTRLCRISRSTELSNPLLGGFLARELFGPASSATASLGSQAFLLSDLGTNEIRNRNTGQGSATEPPAVKKRSGSPSRCRAVVGLCNSGRRPGLDLDFQNSCLVAGYGIKGRFSMFPATQTLDHPSDNIQSFLMCGKDYKLGMAMVYATNPRFHIASAYLAFDNEGRIDSQHDQRPLHMRSTRAVYNENIPIPGNMISSLKYHDSTHKIIVAVHGRGPLGSLCTFSPTLTDPDHAGPAWLLGDPRSICQHFGRQPESSLLESWTNSNSIAPSSSPSLICALGTNLGIVTFDRKDRLTSIIPPRLSPGEIFGLDFLPGQNDVIVAGGRRGKVLLADLRIPPERFEYAAIAHGDADWYNANACLSIDSKTGSSKKKPRPPNMPISHVVGMNENQVLVAGINHKMCIYDLRWRKQGNKPAWPILEGKDKDYKQQGLYSYPASGHTHAPIVTFPMYQNDIHINHGLAVSKAGTNSPMGQMVAVAHNDGSVAIYSARTGRRLPCPALDKVKWMGRAPIQCLQWEQMPNESHESLWMGIGQDIVGVGPTWDMDEGGEINCESGAGGGGGGGGGGVKRKTREF